jgi:acid stress chaperone HdeB
MRIGLTALALCLLTCAPVFAAESLSLAKIHCDDFNKGYPQSNGKLLFWLNGYYMGNDDDAVIDFNRMERQGNALIQFCHDNPSAKLSEAAEKTMGRK